MFRVSHTFRRVGLVLALALLVATARAAAGESSEEPKRPNIVYLLADDLGWADLGCYGSDLHETPNLDRLARQGVRFTDAYAASPVCTPTRAAIMSGEHPARLHMTIWREGAPNPPQKNKVIPPVAVEDLSLEKVTIAERLKTAGYHTAHIGKWHLGDAYHYPETQGFDVNIGATHWGCPATFFYPYRGMLYGDYRYVPDLPYGEDGEFLTDRLTDEALKVIDRAKDQPFFLSLWYHTPHFPIEAKQELIDRYAKKLKHGLRHTNATYAAMVHSMDESVGRILARLEEHGLTEQTVVIFTSDNGGFVNRWKQFPVVTNNAPLRSGKGSLYEGGVRVPLVVRWPGVTKPSTTCTTPAVLTDSYRTIIEMAGINETATDGEISDDGVSLVPLLANPATELEREALYWHYPHYYTTTTPVSAIRSGDWKLLEYLEDGRVELYNLRDDISEQKNLASDMPDQKDRLLRRLHDWREQVDAQMPTRNPDRRN